MLITSVKNNYINKIYKLKDKKERDKTGTFLIEGDNLVSEAIKNNLLKDLIILDNTPLVYDNINPIYVSKEVMKKISSTDTIPQVMGLSLKKHINNSLGNKILILDDIQDPGNLGTIIRSSVAFNVDTIVLSPNTVDLYNPKVLRSTGGMIYNINIISSDTYEFITNLKKDNYHIYGTNVINGKNVKDIKLQEKIAIIIGNEGNGMNKKLNELCDEYIYISMNNKCESLNAGVATSIILYELNK